MAISAGGGGLDLGGESTFDADEETRRKRASRN